MKNIVALVDFSDVTPQVVAKAAEAAKAFRGKLILLHVVPEQPAVVELGLASPTVMQPPSEKKIESDYNQLLDLRDSLANSGADVTVQQLERAGIGKVLEQCRGLETDLIVMGSHHHSALYHLFVGTFTSNVLQRATCPVLVVPAISAAQA
jgi:nucleotide-binding universal stress UspA family protein